MVEWFGRWFHRWFGDHELPDYDLPDPDLAAYDHGLGELRLDGELKGYLASVRLEMSFPARQWWPWFVIVWADGRKDRAFEDYGPKWFTVRELDAGVSSTTPRAAGWKCTSSFGSSPTRPAPSGQNSA